MDSKINVGDEVVKFGKIDYKILNVFQILDGKSKLKEDKVLVLLKDINTGELKEVEVERNIKSL